MPEARPLIVFDLDGTLLSGDSFRFFLSQFLRDPLAAALLLAIGALRGLRLVSHRRFFTVCVGAARHSRLYPSVITRTVAWCRARYRPDVLAHAERFAGAAEALRIVVSASPHDYVTKLPELVGCACYGSVLSPEGVVHLYGEGKRDWLLQNFPADRFRYAACYADSASDASMARLFESSFKVDRHSAAITPWSV